jgi:hypothetical protein
MRWRNVLVNNTESGYVNFTFRDGLFDDFHCHFPRYKGALTIRVVRQYLENLLNPGWQL